MGKFKITDNETGKTVVVSGDAPPTEQEAEQIFKDAGLRDEDGSFLDTAIDMARVIPGSVAQGVNSVLGLPGDIQELVGRGTYSAMNALTGQNKDFNDRPRAGLEAPRSSDLNDIVSAPTGGFYEPKTTAGEYTRTAAQFLPAAVSPGSLVQRAGRVLIPAATSETAGQFTKGTPYEPYARAVGALVGGVGQGLAEGAAASRRNPIPSKVELKDEAGKIYTAAKNSGVTLTPSVYDDLVDDITVAVKDAGTHPKLHPKVDGVIEVLNDARGTSLSLSDLERLRRVARSAAGSIDADEARVGNVILDKIDDFMDAPPANAFATGSPDAAKDLSKAREMWSRVRKSDLIDGAVERAKNAVGANYTAAGYDTALRQQFRRIADSEKLFRTFKPHEKAAILKVVRGGPVQNVLRIFGKLAPRGVVSGAPGLAAGTIDPMLGAAVWGVGETAKFGSNLITARNARVANDLMRAPTAAQVSGQNGNPLMLDLLLSQATPQPAR